VRKKFRLHEVTFTVLLTRKQQDGNLLIVGRSSVYTSTSSFGTMEKANKPEVSRFEQISIFVRFMLLLSEEVRRVDPLPLTEGE
jgi:hypothetical protein